MTQKCKRSACLYLRLRGLASE